MAGYKRLSFLLGLLVILGFMSWKIGGITPNNQVVKATGRLQNIMFAGDSVTFGVYEPKGGYRYFLEQKMIGDACADYGLVGPYTENSMAMIQKNHAGLSGQKTGEFYQKLKTERYVAAYDVDILYLMYGINDYFYGNWDQGTVWMPQIIDEARNQNPNVKIYILAATSLNPAVYTDQDYFLAQRYYNDGIKAVAANKNVPFIDTSSVLQPNMFSDGEHPNTLGYSTLANTIYAATASKCLGVGNTITPVPGYSCSFSLGTCGCVGAECANQAGPNSDWRCCHRECINYACRTVFGQGNNFCEPPDGTVCATTAIPDYKCDNSYGTCGCVGPSCKEEAGPNSDWRCCHRECINYACRTVFGENMPNSCDPPDGTVCGR